MISQSPFIFTGSKSDLSLTLSDPTTLSRYAFRANGTAYGQLCKSVTEIKSDTTIGHWGVMYLVIDRLTRSHSKALDDLGKSVDKLAVILAKVEGIKLNEQEKK